MSKGEFDLQVEAIPWYGLPPLLAITSPLGRRPFLFYYTPRITGGVTTCRIGP